MPTSFDRPQTAIPPPPPSWRARARTWLRRMDRGGHRRVLVLTAAVTGGVAVGAATTRVQTRVSARVRRRQRQAQLFGAVLGAFVGGGWVWLQLRRPLRPVAAGPQGL